MLEFRTNTVVKIIIGILALGAATFAYVYSNELAKADIQNQKIEQLPDEISIWNVKAVDGDHELLIFSAKQKPQQIDDGWYFPDRDWSITGCAVVIQHERVPANFFKKKR